MKIRRSMTIDPDVWHQAQEEARRKRVSASWLTEEALREFLAKIPKPERKTSRAPKLEAAVDLSA